MYCISLKNPYLDKYSKNQKNFPSGMELEIKIMTFFSNHIFRRMDKLLRSKILYISLPIAMFIIIF